MLHLPGAAEGAQHNLIAAPPIDMTAEDDLSNPAHL